MGSEGTAWETTFNPTRGQRAKYLEFGRRKANVRKQAKLTGSKTQTSDIELNIMDMRIIQRQGR